MSTPDSKSPTPLAWEVTWKSRTYHGTLLLCFDQMFTKPLGIFGRCQAQASINNRFKIGVSSMCTSPRTSTEPNDTEPNDTQSALGEEVSVTKRYQLM